DSASSANLQPATRFLQPATCSRLATCSLHHLCDLQLAANLEIRTSQHSSAFYSASHSSAVQTNTLVCRSLIGTRTSPGFSYSAIELSVACQRSLPSLQSRQKTPASDEIGPSFGRTTPVPRQAEQRTGCSWSISASTICMCTRPPFKGAHPSSFIH